MISLQPVLLAAAIGGTAGVLVGMLRRRKKKKRYEAMDEAARQRYASSGRRVMGWLTGTVYTVLGISLIWTLYYALLGILDRSLTDYAADAASLIVSVVTVFSILIAFYEFTHRKD